MSYFLPKPVCQPLSVNEICIASLPGLHFNGWESNWELLYILLQAESTYHDDYLTCNCFLECFPTRVIKFTRISLPKDSEIGGNHALLLTLQKTDMLLLKLGAECTVKDQTCLFF